WVSRFPPRVNGRVVGRCLVVHEGRDSRVLDPVPKEVPRRSEKESFEEVDSTQERLGLPREPSRSSTKSPATAGGSGTRLASRFLSFLGQKHTRVSMSDPGL